MPSEIQTLETRAAGMSSAVLINFFFSFLIGQLFLSMLCAMEWGVFLFFAAWVVIMTLFIYFLLPETKGVPTERVQALFAKHPVWKKVMGAAVAEDIILQDSVWKEKKNAAAAADGALKAAAAADDGDLKAAAVVDTDDAVTVEKVDDGATTTTTL